MKTQFLGVMVLGVVAFNQAPVKNALNVYSLDKKTESSSHQGWIHEFETVQVGREMEHLKKVAPSLERKLAQE